MKRQPQKNQKYIAYIASSIDGVIALEKKKLPDWTSKEDQRFFQDSLKKADAFVMGQNTFEATKKLPRRENTFVLNNQVKSVKKEGGITFVNPQKTDLKLLLCKFKEIAVLGGGQTYQYMLDNKMLGEIYLTVEPIVLGKGIKMFSGGTTTTKLQLLSTIKLNSTGTVLLHYKIKR